MDIDEKVSVAIERAQCARKYIMIREIDYIGAAAHVYEILGKTHSYGVAVEKMFFE